MVNLTNTLLMDRLSFGRALRRLRDEENGLTLTQVAQKLDCDVSLLSRIELGKRLCSYEMFTQLMDLYQVEEEQRNELAKLHADSRRRRQPWWSKYSEVVTASYDRFIGFEDAADRTLEYQLGMVPGLLQTERYARAVTSVGFASLGEDQVDGLVEVRMARQKHRLLGTKRPLTCHYVITQAALEFHIGGREAHAEQLDHLLELSHHDSVTLQILPFETGEDGCHISAFKIFQFPDELPDMAFTDSVAGNVALEDPRDLRRLHRLFRNLAGTALNVGQSRDLIARIKNRED
ncbi:helix-turn-helix domain-containing protein [Streptomyces carpaticus]|uniref:helix-turn-helix domain-containing protein n=1 Tax=Streptomyces carpaticus TaxID=285558 RepID=UPI00220ACF02|nr:helix-turn-helix domain-containing protein [Streptomyces carpaticus]